MATSLSAQLQRLRTPQAKTQVDARYRKSILFNTKEAAEKDRRTIYNIGVNGLKELILLNPCFQQFEGTLFDESTLHFERSVECNEVNELLNENINKFLIYLSPYFLLRPAQMCIEWLIRRFYVNEYNNTAFLTLILPYHDTKIFVRALQAINLHQADKNNNIDWLWLCKLQKAGLTAPISLIANHASSTPSFLQLICQHTGNIMKEFGKNGHLAQSHLNFYATVVVGALDKAAIVQEKHMLAILPSILQALNSKIADFVSAAYVIIAELVSRTQLTFKLYSSFVQRISAVSIQHLQTTATILLITIIDKQEASKTKSQNSYIALIKNNWLTGVLSKLCNENIDISPLCILLMKMCIKIIQNNSSEKTIAVQFLERLISDVTLPSVVALRLISCFLDLYVEPQKNVNKTTENDVIQLSDSDDESNVSFQKWYSKYLNRFQRQYPNEFDQTIKDTFRMVNVKCNRRSALNMAIGVHLKFADKNVISLYESIYHPLTNFRLEAIETLIGNLSNYKNRPKYYEILKNCLSDRMYNEDDERVIAEFLKLPVKDFIDILGVDRYMDIVFTILHRSEINEKEWRTAIECVIEHLTSKSAIEQCDSNLLLLALLPILSSYTSDELTVRNISKILNSPLVKHFKFLKQLKIEKERVNGEFSASVFSKHLRDVLLTSVEKPTANELLESIKGREKVFKTVKHFSCLILLLTGCLKPNLECAKTQQIFKYFCKSFDIFNNSNSAIKGSMAEIISPKHLIGDFLKKLVMMTDFKNLLCWTDKGNLDLLCIMQIFEWLVIHAFQTKCRDEKVAWIQLLQDVIKLIFVTDKEKIDFLSNFYLHHDFQQFRKFHIIRLTACNLFDNIVKTTNVNLTTEHLLKILTSLSSPSETLRVKALNTLTLIPNDLVSSTWAQFIELIIARSYEITIDEEQFALVMYTILKKEQKEQKHQININEILKDILMQLSILNDNNVSLTSEVLHILRHVNNVEILTQLAPLAKDVINKSNNEDGILLLQNPYNRIYELLIERLDYHTIEAALLQDSNVWKLIETSIKRYDVFLKTCHKLQPLPCRLLDAFDEQIYAELPSKYKLLLIKEIITTISQVGNDEIFLAANKFLKKCVIDCKMFDGILKGMFYKDSLNIYHKSTTAKKRILAPPRCDIGSTTWKQGVSLLELLDNKKKLLNAHELIPIVFELMWYCLGAEEQARTEYTKQLTLSTLNHFLRISLDLNINLQKELSQSSFKVEQIVQCLRSTTNPQTQNNALLLLSTCANIFPQQVLNQIVDTFTFMGSSVARQEDAFSFYIVSNIIETIIPMLVGRENKFDAKINGDEKVLAVSVLKVFSDIILDVPDHRCLPLYTKLLQTLGAKQFLWIFLCVVFESHVIAEGKHNTVKKKIDAKQNDNERPSKRIELMFDLINCFETEVVVDTCIHLMNYIQRMPLSKNDATKVDASNSKIHLDPSTNDSDVALFDISCRTSKELRHYRYVIMQFLSSLINSTTFLEKIAGLNDEGVLQMRPYIQNFIISILSYVPYVNEAIEHIEEKPIIKYWKVISNHLHDILENAVSLLSSDMFLEVIIGLIEHKVLSIRKKVIEMLISKLHRKDEYIDSSDPTKIQEVLQSLTTIVDSITTRTPESAAAHEVALLQQNTLIAIKLLSKKFALNYMDEFKVLMSKLILIIKNRSNISKIVVATSVLAVVDVSCNLKAHSLAFMPKYMPLLIDVLQEQIHLLENQLPDSICLSIITGIHKVVETLPLFLGPYVMDIILVVSMLMKHISTIKLKPDQRCANTLQKTSAIWTKLASFVPLRILVPCCVNAYLRLIETQNYNEVEPLMNLMHETLRNAELNDLNMMQKDITNFFMQALKFRLYIDEKDLTHIETNIITTFTAWILKLSESSFRPIYQTVSEWVFKEAKAKPIVLVTFFRLTTQLSDALKSLFVIFSSNLADVISKLLKEYNLKALPTDTKVERWHSELLAALFHTLNNICLYDKKFINVHRFELIMQPLVNQIENTIVQSNDMLQKIIVTCIAQLAVAASSDVLWKQLNYQVLLKTRINIPEVRILAFASCVEIAKKLGEDFTTLLPETVPFVAELFEDENPRVEKNIRNLVHELESVLGESIQKYL